MLGTLDTRSSHAPSSGASTVCGNGAGNNNGTEQMCQCDNFGHIFIHVDASAVGDNNGTSMPRPSANSTDSLPCSA